MPILKKTFDGLNFGFLGVGIDFSTCICLQRFVYDYVH